MATNWIHYDKRRLLVAGGCEEPPVILYGRPTRSGRRRRRRRRRWLCLVKWRQKWRRGWAGAARSGPARLKSSEFRKVWMSYLRYIQRERMPRHDDDDGDEDDGHNDGEQLRCWSLRRQCRTKALSQNSLLLLADGHSSQPAS